MKKFLTKLVNGFLFIAIIDIAIASLWSWGVIQTFDEKIPKSPIAAVLMHKFDKRTGELGPETTRRLNHALDLYREGKVKYILCVGGARPKHKIFGSEFMRDFLIDKGVSEGDIVLEKESYDTKTNWYMMYKIVSSRGWVNLIVVSSPFHLHRLRRIVKEEPQGYLHVHFSPYSLKEARPPATYFQRWKSVHYEWLAHFAQMIPEKPYRSLLKFIRDQE